MSRERRSYPRYPVELAVLVEVPAEPCSFHDATASNLSRTSMQISCQADLVAALLQQQTLPYTCALRFRLPWHQHEFNLKAQLVTHRRLSQQHYVLVLLFRHDDEVQELLLDELLARQQSVGLT